MMTAYGSVRAQERRAKLPFAETETVSEARRDPFCVVDKQ